MKRKIILNNKEFTMPKMSIDTYTESLMLTLSWVQPMISPMTQPMIT